MPWDEDAYAGRLEGGSVGGRIKCPMNEHYPDSVAKETRRPTPIDWRVIRFVRRKEYGRSRQGRSRTGRAYGSNSATTIKVYLTDKSTEPRYSRV